MRHTVPMLAGLFLLLVALPAIAQNDYEPDSAWVRGDRWAVVKRMDINLFGIPVRAGGLSADARARVVANDRMDLLLGGGVLSVPENIEVGLMNGEVVIYVANPKGVGGLPDPTLILTIDRNFERYMGESRWDIAYWWRDLMRKWSRAGVIKGPMTDPAGRAMDNKETWHRVPHGWAGRYGR